MSELKVDKVSPRTGNYVALNTVGSKNIIINGDMSIAQRGTSESSIGATGGTYLLDRFEFTNVGALGTWTMSQDTDVPSAQGFSKSLKLDCTTADAAPAASDVLILRQLIEGQNLQYLKKGTANASSLTASFWVKSNKTGTYILELFDNDNTRTINKSYTINTANTWEKKTITYPGDTTGAFDNDNGASLYFQFWLGAGTNFTSGTLATSWEALTNANRAVGQVNLADDTANDWYITGIQLEAGTTASDFEFLPVDVNLARCQRYFLGNLYIGGSGYATAGGQSATAITTLNYPSTMRATPSLSYTSVGGFNANGSLTSTSSHNDNRGGVFSESASGSGRIFWIGNADFDAEL